MATNTANQNEKALLHLTLETVTLSLRKVFRELAECGPSCRKNVLKHLTELSLQLDAIEKQLSVGDWAKLKLANSSTRQTSKSLKRRIGRGTSKGRRHVKQSSSSNRRRER